MMMTRHYQFWPKRFSTSLPVPQTNLYDNLAVSARRYPDNAAIYYYGGVITYRRFNEEVEALAGFLQKKLGVGKGERVLLYMQNSPQFMLAYYGILRANAVVVPLNPMYIRAELEFYINDSEAKAAFVGQELFERIAPLLKNTFLQHVVLATYREYIGNDYDMEIPVEVSAPRITVDNEGVIYWQDAISAGLLPEPLTAAGDDMAVMPYTSGTTGIPKGCVHTHATVNANTAGAAAWWNMSASVTTLTSLPLFHVTGMIHSMNAQVFAGGTIVLMTRWNRELAAALIDRYGCTHWVNIATMVIDFLANPKLADYKLQTLTAVGGGGAPLPEAVGEKLFQLLGVRYVEGYGLSETISQTHFNPPDRPKLQCMGVPSFDVDARIIDPETLQELGPGEQGEVVVHGPQVLKGYWKRPEETKDAFVTIEGKQFFRTGDIARYDEEGYFFIIDRVKRMINASGFKVWPTEVESTLYRHPAIKEACVVGTFDSRRGETVKAFVILHDAERGKIGENDIIEWSKEKMASYKYPRIVEFVESLPKTASGKILWRKLQEEEKARAEQG